jgi:hypothetical protein
MEPLTRQFFVGAVTTSASVYVLISIAFYFLSAFYLMI